MKKKLSIVIMFFLCCTLLTGCAWNTIKTSVNNILSDIDTSNFKNTVAEDNLYPMTQSTKDAQTAALEAQDKASKWDEKATKVKWYSFPPLVNALYTHAMQNKWSTEAVATKDTYESAKATDSAFLKARESTGIVGDISSINFRSYGLLIAVVIVILIIMLFALLRISKRKSKAEVIRAKKQKTVVQEVPVQTALPETKAPLLMERNDQRSIDACKKYCKKFDIDYDTMLAQYGGDPKSLLDVLVISRKEDFHNT